MIGKANQYDPGAPIIVVDIGNTSTRLATWHDDSLKTPLSVQTADEKAFAEAFAAHTIALPKGGPAAVVIGSVVPKGLSQVRAFIARERKKKALVVGEDLPLPIDVGVTDPKAIGVDRVCAAAAVYDKIQSACIIIDFGTAVTVDLVDDTGILVGGAILPGLRLQLRSLHEHTAVLPLVEPEMPALPYGRNTEEAMRNGVCRGVAGAARALVEAYAVHLNRWPQVVATGGDLAFVAPYCDYLDTQVQNLVLRGVALAYSKYMKAKGA